MGKRRKGSNKMGGKLEKLADAVSDDDNTAQIGLEDMYDEVLVFLYSFRKEGFSCSQRTMD